MRYLAVRLSTLLLLTIAGPLAYSADPADQPKSPPAPNSQTMKMKEPMSGEMKKDGMMKEDVSKASKKWSAEMDEKMKREKMK